MILGRRTPGLLLAVMVLAALVCLHFPGRPTLRQRPGEAPVDPEQPQAADPKPEELTIPVKVADAKRGELVIRLKSPGEAVSDLRVVMRTEVGGIVKDLRVREGLHVKAGDLLVLLDDERPRLALERQEADRLRLLSEMLLEKRFSEITLPPAATSEKMSKAREDLAAAEARYGRGLVSPADLERASKNYETSLIEAGLKKEEVMAASKGLTQAEISVKTARLDLERTKVKAPFAGIITGIKVSPGESLGIGGDLFTLVNISGIRVAARVLESEVGRMKVGRGADLRFSAYPGRVFEGTVEAISPIVDPEDRTCSVRIAVDNPGEEIKPGMHAEAEIVADVYGGRLLVPQEAVLVRSGRKLVFVVEERRAKWRYVEVGLENEAYAEVLEGVREGEKVIVEGHFTLAHDARVTVTR